MKVDDDESEDEEESESEDEGMCHLSQPFMCPEPFFGSSLYFLWNGSTKLKSFVYKNFKLL